MPAETLRVAPEEIALIEYTTYNYRSKRNSESAQSSPRVELVFKRKDGSKFYPDQPDFLDPKDANTLVEKFDIPVERVKRVIEVSD